MLFIFSGTVKYNEKKAKKNCSCFSFKCVYKCELDFYVMCRRIQSLWKPHRSRNNCIFSPFIQIIKIKQSLSGILVQVHNNKFCELNLTNNK